MSRARRLAAIPITIFVVATIVFFVLRVIPGDVVTLEPGLYRQGFGGCRLEDLVVVTEDGAENLTKFPYDLTP